MGAGVSGIAFSFDRREVLLSREPLPFFVSFFSLLDLREEWLKLERDLLLLESRCSDSDFMVFDDFVFVFFFIGVSRGERISSFSPPELSPTIFPRSGDNGCLSNFRRLDLDLFELPLLDAADCDVELDDFERLGDFFTFFVRLRLEEKEPCCMEEEASVLSSSKASSNSAGSKPEFVDAALITVWLSSFSDEERDVCWIVLASK